MKSQSRRFGDEMSDDEKGNYLPFPDKLAVCGLPGALSLTFSTAVRVPVACGVKVMPTLQVFRLVNVLPQVVDGSAKSFGSAPDRGSATLNASTSSMMPFQVRGYP